MRSNLMFIESSFSTIFLPVIVVFVIASWIARFYLVRGKKGLEREFASIQISLVCGGCLIVFLLFLLPSTPVLGSFGYPKTLADIDDPSNLLRLLQKYNQALVRTTSILHFLMLIFVFFVIEPFYRLAKSVGSQRSDS
jgi:hypothetical protein